jgi:RNA-splicing ligase RtcB
MSRNQAKKNISMDDYTATMKDVYSTSVCNETIDESPMAYKPTEEIKALIADTVDILYMLPSKINIKATKPQK